MFSDYLFVFSTAITRVRGFLRLAIIQKKLGDYFQVFLTACDLPRFYEPWALVRDDSAAALAGSLLALGVFDCNLILDYEHLVEQTPVFDLSAYVKIPTVCTLPQVQAETDGELELKAILDQKHYLEEYNQQLL